MPSPEPHVRAGRSALDEGQLTQAVAHLTRALELDPNHFEALSVIALAYARMGRRIDALRALNPILSSGRATPETWLSAGDLLAEVGEWAQALATYERAVSHEGSSPQAHHQLAMAAYKLGDLDRAVDHLRIAAAGNPAPGSLAGLATIIPGALGSSQREILEARRMFADRLAGGSPLAGRRRPGPYANARPRIGYLSGHFHGSNYMKPVWALINHHDRSRFQLCLLSDAEDSSLEFPGYQPHSDDELHHVGGFSNGALADFIASKKIDLFVDLSGYVTVPRLELFLSPVAPVVVTWFTPFATTGFPGIDVIVTDDEAVRPVEESFYSESVRRLPLSYLTFEVTYPVPLVVPPPCLSKDHFTFGSLVTQYKIGPAVFDAWSEILRGAPGSRLLLANSILKSKENRRWVSERFAERGIEADRLSLLGPADHHEYLRYYDQIDVALDAFPYNGGTTTMEAIWQGVPVVTFDGDRWASRTSQTLLRRSHLSRFVADSVAGMIGMAQDLANDPGTPEVLAELRAGMRSRLAAESLCDAAGLARSLESLYEDLLAPGS